MPKVSKNVIQGAGWLGQNDVTRDPANSIGMPRDQKSKQS